MATYWSITMHEPIAIHFIIHFTHNSARKLSTFSFNCLG